MNNRVDNTEIAQRKLRELKITLDAGKVMKIIRLLKSGVSPHRMYNPPDREKPLAANYTVFKITKALDAGELDWMTDDLNIESCAWTDMFGWVDPFGETRYRIVMEAEEMAPHKWWTIQHMRSIGYSADDARKLLIQYDEIRTYRERATTIKEFEPNTTVMARFHDLQTYLTLLYEMYYRTTYPEAPIKWLKIAAQLRVEGELNSDRGLVAAGDDIFRYQVWGMEEDGMLQSKNKCLNAYLESLKRLFKTRPKAYDKLKKRIRQPK